MTRAHALLALATPLALCLGAACNPNNSATSATADQSAESGAGAEAGAEADPAAEAEAAVPAESGAGAEAEAGAAEAGAAAEAGPAEGAATGEAGSETGGAAAETGAAADPAAQIESLLDEVKKKRTKDDRALAALAEAEKLEADPVELAKVANKRGESLMASPDRATKFFEYARDKDPKYPDPSFNLAKLAANTADIPAAIEHLTEVKKRGGKKLLRKLDSIPEFMVLADDPEVQALVRGK